MINSIRMSDFDNVLSDIAICKNLLTGEYKKIGYLFTGNKFIVMWGDRNSETRTSYSPDQMSEAIDRYNSIELGEDSDK